MKGRFGLLGFGVRGPWGSMVLKIKVKILGLKEVKTKNKCRIKGFSCSWTSELMEFTVKGS